MTTQFQFCTKLFIVRTSMDRGDHHGLHTNTSPFVLTDSPKAGDVVETYLAISGDYEIANESLKLVSGSIRLCDNYRFALLSHAGRSALLGEDGLEDATGHDCLLELVGERLLGTKTWSYAPCDLRVQKSSKDGTDLPRSVEFTVSEDRQSLILIRS